MDEWTYRKLLGGHSNLSNCALRLELINNNSMVFLSFGWEKVVTLHNHDIIMVKMYSCSFNHGCLTHEYNNLGAYLMIDNSVT